MSAILAILLMLGGAFFVIPYAHADGTAPTAVKMYISGVWANETVQYNPPTTTLMKFNASVYLENVVDLFTWQAGFSWDPTYLKCLNIYQPTWFNGGNAGATSFQNGTIDNLSGIFTFAGETLHRGATGKSGSGPILIATFEVEQNGPGNPFWPPYTGTAPGTPVLAMHFDNSGQSSFQIDFWDSLGNEMLPAADTLHDGYFTMYVAPSAPTAHFTITPPTGPYYVGDTLSFDGTSSLPGSSGYMPASFTNFTWNFGDGTYYLADGVHNPFSKTVTHSYSSTGSYSVTLTVWNDVPLSNSWTKTPAIVVGEKPTGCVIDVFTQNWRYIDPITLQQTPNGKGLRGDAELFRPGDLVHLYAVASYNGDPVRAQVITFQVWDNNGAEFLTASAVTDDTGLAEVIFRIPWPSTIIPEGGSGEPTFILPDFGTWHVMVTWEIGNMGQQYGSWTQNDTMNFNVGWGVWSSDLEVLNGPWYVDGQMTVKYNLHNDYQEDVSVLNSITVYDDLAVPIIYNKEWETVFANTVLPVTMTLTIPHWAFVGSNCVVKGNELTALVSGLGIAWGPEQVAGFAISHTYNPHDP